MKEGKGRYKKKGCGTRSTAEVPYTIPHSFYLLKSNHSTLV